MVPSSLRTCSFLGSTEEVALASKGRESSLFSCQRNGLEALHLGRDKSQVESGQALIGSALSLNQWSRGKACGCRTGGSVQGVGLWTWGLAPGAGVELPMQGFCGLCWYLGGHIVAVCLRDHGCSRSLSLTVKHCGFEGRHVSRAA